MIGSDIAPMAGVTDRRVTLGVDDGDDRLRRSDPIARRRTRRVGKNEVRRLAFDALYGDQADD